MKTLGIVLLYALVLSTAVAQVPQAPQLEWAKSYGANRRVGEGRNPSLLAVDAAGNVFIAGAFSGTVDFDPGPGLAERTSAGAFDAYLLKLDAAGNFQWVYHIGGTGADQAGAVAVDGSGHVYITGSFNAEVDFDPGPGTAVRTAQGNQYVTKIGSSRYSQDMYICKLTGNGELVRVITIPGSEGNMLGLDAAGNVVVMGGYGASTQTPTDFNPGSGTHLLSYPDSLCCGSYMLKLDSAGNFRWAWHLGVGSNSRTMKVDPAGNIYYAGISQSSVIPDFNPGPADSIGVNSAPYIIKLDSAGRFRWARQPEGGDAEFFNLALTSTHLYATGYFQGTVDFNPGAGTANLTSAGSYDICMLVLDTAGNYLVSERLGGSGTDIGTAIMVDAAGSLYVGGIFGDTVDINPTGGVTNVISKGGDDGLVVKFAPSGHLVWAWTASARNDRDTLEDHDYVYGLALGPQGHLYVDGMFNDTIDADPCSGTFNLISTRPQESFIVKLNQQVCAVTSVPVAHSAGDYSLIPNPATQSVTLSGPRDFAGSTLRLLNLTGEIVKEWKDVHGRAFALDLSGQAVGVYFVEIAGADQVQRLQLVVQ